MDNQHQPRQWAHGADLIVSQLEAQGVQQVFGIPGAKIDKVFDSLLDSSIRIIPVRHEANAAFMAAAVGRITGKAGVALVTSGPGCSNLITGMATANSEGDPVVALGGAVKRADKAKQVHQSMDTVAMFSPVTKYSVEVTAAEALAEVVSNAFRAAEQGRPGSAFVSLPQDVVDEPVHARVLPASDAPQTGAAPDEAIERVAKMIAGAKNPIFLLGLMASQAENSAALRELLKKSHIPVTSTYQAAGAVNQDHFTRFAGRVGLFNNQAGDRLLHLADLVICIGYSPVEYEPAMWNNGNATLVHIDVLPAYEERNYTPDIELVGNIAATLNKLSQRIDHQLVLSPPASAGAARPPRRAAEPVCPSSAAHRSRHAGHRQQRRDADRRYGELSHLDRPLSLQLPRPSGHDFQRPADHGGGAALGDWRLAGEPAAQSGFGFRRRRLPAIQYGAGDRRTAKS